MAVFLTPDQMQALTDSRVHRQQVKWLIENGIRFVTSTKGRPKVLISVVEKRLGGVPTPEKKSFNFDALDRYGSDKKTPAAPPA